MYVGVGHQFFVIFSISVVWILLQDYTIKESSVIKIAIISMAGNPLDKPYELSMCGKGGQSPYVREVGKHLSKVGFNVTIFTRSESADHVGRVVISSTLRVKYVVAGPQYHLFRDLHYHHLDNFTAQVNPSEFDAVFTNYWLSGLVGLKLGLPQIHVHHSLGAQKFEWEPVTEIGKIRMEAERQINKRADCVVHQLRRENLLTNATRWTYITPGIDTAMFQGLRKERLREKLNFDSNVTNILYVGRFVPQKGIKFALDAFSRAKTPLKFRLIGAHKNSPSEHLVHKYPQFEYLGPRPLVDVAQYMSASDILVVPSLYEPFGLVLLEGMAAGCALLVTSVGGPDEMVVDGVNGLKVPPADSDAILHAFERLASNKAMMKKMGQRNRVIGMQNSWEVTAGKLAKNIKEIIQKQVFSP